MQQMLEFLLAGFYKLFISILRNMEGLRMRSGAPLTRSNTPVVFFATACSKAVQTPPTPAPRPRSNNLPSLPSLPCPFMYYWVSWPIPLSVSSC